MQNEVRDWAGFYASLSLDSTNQTQELELDGSLRYIIGPRAAR